MPEFNYEAMANTGIGSQGTFVAGSEREVMAMLDARGLFPVRIDIKKAIATGSTGRKKVGSRHLATSYSQLADLLHSGVPLLRSLDILERQAASPALREVVREIRARVADGTSIADAMAQHPRVFNELAISMVRAGQEGSFLEDVLRRIANFTEHQEDLKSKVTGATAYPVFLAVVGFIVLNILVIFFVPIFKKLEEKGELPFLTTAIVVLSDFPQSYRVFVLAAGALGIFQFRRWTKSPAGRLIDIADGLEKRTSRQLDLFVRLLEPLMLLVMAVVTLVIVAGLQLPVFKMSSVVG